MKQNFLFNIVLIILVNLLIKPVYIFGIDIPVQNLVGNESYGTFATFLNFAYLFQIINDPGIQNYNSREIAANPVLISRFFPQILIVKSFLAVLFIIFVAIGSSIMGYWSMAPQLLCVVIVNQILVSFLLYIRSNVSALGRYSVDSLLSVADKLFMIFVIGCFIWVFPNSDFSILQFAIIQGLSYLVVILIALPFILMRTVTLKWKWRPVMGKIILKDSLPYAALLFLMFIYSRTDIVMIEYLLPDGAFQAGIYVAAYRIMDAFAMFTFLFATLLVPMFSKMLKEKEPIDSLFYTSFKWISAISLIAVISFFSYAGNWMNLLYDSTTPQSGQILMILLLSFAFKATNFVTGSVLVASGRLKKLNAILILTVFLNILANFILIQRHGPLGAAWATLISQIIVAFGMYILSIEYLAKKHSLRPILRIILAVFLSISLHLLVIQLSDVLQWIYIFFISICGTAIVCLLTGLVRVGELAYFATGILNRDSRGLS